MGEMVASTGGGGQGESDAADVIFQEDTFGHILAFIMHGRNLYFNIRKFL